MRTRPLRTTALALLVTSGACSLRSLEHLRSDENGAVAAAAAGALQTGGGAGVSTSGGTGGAPSAGGSGASGSGASAGGITSGSGGALGSGGTSGSGGAVSTTGGGGGTGGADTGDAGEDGGGGEGNGPSCTPGEPGCPPLPVEEIPYVLRPGHAPSKCIDIWSFGVDDAVTAIQYRCFHQINQVFWAEDHGDGYLSFRNALSGKCLDVAAWSEDSDAPIHQWTCTGYDNQLFLPVPVSDELVTLVAKHSGLVVDVRGSASSEDNTPIVQSTDDGSADMTWTLERSDVGAYVTLAADDQTDLLLRHDGEQVLLETSTEGSVEWKVVAGLANRSCISLASRDDTSRYLRQTGFELFREPNDASEAFGHDATFCFRTPFTDTTFLSRTLESEGQPGYYLARSEGRVVLAPFEDTDAFRSAATWQVGQIWP